MKQRLMTLKDSRLYCITAGRGVRGYEETTAAVCEGGVDVIQLREKEMSVRDLIALARRLKAVCAHYGALLIVNDRPDVALLADAHGVHVGQDDLPLAAARKIVGHGKIVGVSAHSLKQALEAQSGGADYTTCGPLWATPTKPDYNPVGLGLIAQYKVSVKIPFFCIGGIEPSNVDQVLAAGAERVASVRAIWNAPDPKAAVKEFKKKIATFYQEVTV
jgi:thiamine-phosphate pyrophosphorylase